MSEPIPTGIQEDDGSQRHLDEALTPEDIAAIHNLVPMQSYDSPDYDDSEAGDWEDDEDGLVEDDDGEDDPDADFSGDEFLMEVVDYGEAEEGLEE